MKGTKWDSMENFLLSIRNMKIIDSFRTGFLQLKTNVAKGLRWSKLTRNHEKPAHRQLFSNGGAMRVSMIVWGRVKLKKLLPKQGEHAFRVNVFVPQFQNCGNLPPTCISASVGSGAP